MKIIIVTDRKDTAGYFRQPAEDAGFYYHELKPGDLAGFYESLPDPEVRLIIYDLRTPDILHLEQLRELQSKYIAGEMLIYFLLPDNPRHVFKTFEPDGVFSFPPDQNLIKQVFSIVRALARRRPAVFEEIKKQVFEGENLLNLIDSMGDFIFILNMKGEINFMNRVFEIITGFSVLNYPGKQFSEVVDTADHEKFQRVFSRLTSGEVLSHIQLRLKSKNNNPVYLDVLARPVFHDGEQSGVMGIGRNVTSKYNLESLIKQQDELYRVIVSNSIDVFSIINYNLKFVFLSPSFYNVTGFNPEEMIGEYVFDRVHPDDVSTLKKTLSTVRDYVNVPQRSRYRYRHKAGHYIYIESIGVNLSENAVVNGVMITSRDISFQQNTEDRLLRMRNEIEQKYHEKTQHLKEKNIELENEIIARKIAEDNLRFQKSYNESLVNLSPAFIVAVDRNGRILTLNSSFEKLTGKKANELFGRNFVDELVSEPQRAFVSSVIEEHLSEEESRSKVMTSLRGAGGERYYIEWFFSPFLHEDNKISAVIGLGIDVTARKKAEAKLRKNRQDLIFAAFHDNLTGLPNRLSLQRRLRKVFKRGQSGRKNSYAAILIDFDRFKLVNDSLGHPIGDKLLVTLSEEIKALSPPDIFISRIGGDEFALLFDHIKGKKSVVKLADTIRKRFETPIRIEEYEIAVTASIGVAFSSGAEKEAEDILRSADTAMFRAKDNGRNRYYVYSEDLHKSIIQKLNIEHLMRRALENDEFVLHFQPKYNFSDSRIEGFETLIRWQQPRRGLVMPGEFISIAEDSGLIIPMGEWVINRLAEHLKKWSAEKLPHFNVALNISPRQFYQKNLVETFEKAFSSLSGWKSHIEIEITESIVLADDRFILETVQKLCDMGFGITIDDFGTGYSALSYIKKFPLTTLKIDRSFIRDIPEDNDDMLLTKAIIAMARSLNLKTVAEGVETPEQFDFLKESGCDQVQGFVLSPAVPSEQVPELLKKYNRI